ncbi:MAG: EAL and HDOD domain-containing protein [Cellulomonas sp.]
MTDTRNAPMTLASSRGTEITVHRQPVVHPDRTVHGYAVNVLVRAPLTSAHLGDELDAMVHSTYRDLDFTLLANEDVVFLRATTGMLTGEVRLPRPGGGLVLEVPRHFATLPDAAAWLARLREGDVGVALADYVAGGDQDALLELVDFAKIDLGRGLDAALVGIARAHEHHVAVIVERVASEAAVRFCLSHEVDLLQGPLFQRDAPTRAREFTAGQVQCLELLQLLHAEQVDLDRVIQVVDADPELAMRVLGLVNSSASGVRHRIDSVKRAIVLIGPKPLSAIAAASLVDATNLSIAGLWFVLTRAIACRTLGGDDAAYTVGLLSAVAAELRVEPADLIARTGVSDDVADALLSKYGPYGAVLGAVLAHEENDLSGVEATGLGTARVADAYLAAVVEALATTRALAG